MNLAQFTRIVKSFLPAYLSTNEYANLIAELKNYPNNKSLYLTGAQDVEKSEVWQGDCWSGIPIQNINSGEQQKITCTVISNSCDIDTNNERLSDRWITVTPTVPTKSYEQSLLTIHTPEQVRGHIEGIRNQKASDRIYFHQTALNEDRVALLDQSYSIPLHIFQQNARSRIFRLNNAGFYILLLKLSIHFTRMQEKIHRSQDEPNRGAKPPN